MRSLLTALAFILTSTLLQQARPVDGDLVANQQQLQKRSSQLSSALKKFISVYDTVASYKKAITQTNEAFWKSFTLYMNDISQDMAQKSGRLTAEEQQEYYSSYQLEEENMLNHLNEAYTTGTIQEVENALRYELIEISDKVDAGITESKSVRKSQEPRSVMVKVRVLKKGNNEELAGFYAFCKPKYSSDARLVQAFNPTLNAVKKIIPGIKMVWIEKDGIKLGERVVEFVYRDEKATVDFYVD
jgi:hypothetical protein